MNQQPMWPAEERNTAELSQWFTEARLARRIVEWADLPPGSRVLEPSAGDGAFLRAGPALLWTAVEIDRRHAGALGTLALSRSGPIESVVQADFLTLAPTDPNLGAPFDGVIMNPPYEDDADVRHVRHALEFAPRVIALLRSAFRHGEGRWETFWRHVAPVRQAELVSRPRFGDGGGARSDFTVWEFRKRDCPIERGHRDAVEVEQW